MANCWVPLIREWSSLGEAISMMLLCIVENPIWNNPRDNNVTKDRMYHGEMENARRDSAKPKDPNQKILPCRLILDPRNPMINEPEPFPIPSAEARSPIRPGPTLRCSSAMTGIYNWYWNNIFIIMVAAKVALMACELYAWLMPSLILWKILRVGCDLDLPSTLSR